MFGLRLSMLSICLSQIYFYFIFCYPDKRVHLFPRMIRKTSLGGLVFFLMSNMTTCFFRKALVLSQFGMGTWMQALCLRGRCTFHHPWNIPMLGWVRSLLSIAVWKASFTFSSLKILPVPSMSWVETKQVFLLESQPRAMVGRTACRQRHRQRGWAPASPLLPLATSELGWRWALWHASGSSWFLHCPGWGPGSSVISTTSFCPMKSRLQSGERWMGGDECLGFTLIYSWNATVELGRDFSTLRT